MNAEKSLQEALNEYIKQHHTQEECIGFIDGYNGVMLGIKELIQKRIKHIQDETNKSGGVMAYDNEVETGTLEMLLCWIEKPHLQPK